MTDRLEFSPGLDLVTGRAAVMLQDRAVVGLSGWLRDAARAAVAEGRELQLVTPAGTRLTQPARTEIFRRRACRWVVRDPDTDELYDGLRGARLAWDGERFAPVLTEPGDRPAPSPTWLAETELTACLQVVARVRHQPLDSAVVGTATEWLFRELSGAAPLGWGTEEPVSQPCGRTTSHRSAAGGCPSELARGGRRWHGDRLDRGAPPPGRSRGDGDALGGTAGARAAGAGRAVGRGRPAGPGVRDRLGGDDGLRAAPDTSVPARFTGVRAPIGVGVGPAGIAAIGIDAALSLDGHDARAVGPATEASVWYPVGDGREVTGWTAFARLLTKLAG